MKPLVATLLMASTVSLGAALPALAKCEALYAATEALIRQGEERARAPQILEEARRCAETGIKYHRQGRHPESMKTLRQCLKILED